MSHDRPDRPAPRPPSADGAKAHYIRGGELRSQRRPDEALAAFDAAIALRPDYAEAHNSRGIVLASVGRLVEALVSFDKAIAQKPDYAEAFNNRGMILQDLQRLDDALGSFRKAIALQPDNARACNNLGAALWDAKRFDEAIENCDKAIALKPDYAEAHYNRALALQDLWRLDEALAGYRAAIALRPNYAAAYANLGVVLQQLGRPEEAIAAYDQVKAMGGDHLAEANVNQSYCFLQLGDFAQGFRLHEWRNRTPQTAAGRRFPQPVWLGAEDIRDKSLFIPWEQGFGDTLQFGRYAKLTKARGARVAMSVQTPLYRLFRQMAPDVAILNGDDAPAAFDYQCPLMSLPLAFGTTFATVPAGAPYLAADPQLREAWRAQIPPSDKPRIGVVWSGNAKQKNDRNRSIGLPAFAPILSADAQWISLQLDVRDGDAALIAAHPHLLPCPAGVRDFADTAAIMDLLDLVITVDTSVAHLAGAMGKPLWIMLAFNADWRWLIGRDDCPWYPSARLFRQQRIGSWDNVVARIKAELDAFLRSRP
jgi:tetratricopeptide (TPR) repeat protein